MRSGKKAVSSAGRERVLKVGVCRDEDSPGADIMGKFGFLCLARDLGAQRAIEKPFHPREIVAAVNELLDEA